MTIVVIAVTGVGVGASVGAIVVISDFVGDLYETSSRFFSYACFFDYVYSIADIIVIISIIIAISIAILMLIRILITVLIRILITMLITMLITVLITMLITLMTTIMI